MKHVFTILAFTLMTSGLGQILYPYNPDENLDTYISTPDLMSFLTLYGQSFIPEPIIVDSLELSDILWSLQNQIDSLNVLTADGLENGYVNDSLLQQALIDVQTASIQADSALVGWLEAVSSELASLSEVESVHGHLDIPPGDSLAWLVPAGINFLEVTLTGGNGSPGQGTNSCPYTSGNAVGGCGGAAGGMGRFLIGVVEGDTIFVSSGSTPNAPGPLGGCGVGQNGYTGSSSEILINGQSVMIATGGGGGKGVWCSCGSSYNHCGLNPNPNPSAGTIIGPSVNSGAILLESGSGGGGNCLIRY